MTIPAQVKRWTLLLVLGFDLVTGTVAFRAAYRPRPPAVQEMPVQQSSARDHASQVVAAWIGRSWSQSEMECADGQIAQVVVDESVRASFDPLFVVSVIEVESHFDHTAISSTGARGLMQITPTTWKYELLLLDRASMDPMDSCDNVRVGVDYMHRLSRSFTRPETLLLAYNQGPAGASGIITGRAGASDEARDYVPEVLQAYRYFLGLRDLDNRNVRRFWRSPQLTLLDPSFSPPTYLARQ